MLLFELFEVSQTVQTVQLEQEFRNRLVDWSHSVASLCALSIGYQILSNPQSRERYIELGDEGASELVDQIDDPLNFLESCFYGFYRPQIVDPVPLLKVLQDHKKESTRAVFSGTQDILEKFKITKSQKSKDFGILEWWTDMLNVDPEGDGEAVSKDKEWIAREQERQETDKSEFKGFSEKFITHLENQLSGLLQNEAFVWETIRTLGYGLMLESHRLQHLKKILFVTHCEPPRRYWSLLHASLVRLRRTALYWETKKISANDSVNMALTRAVYESLLLLLENLSKLVKHLSSKYSKNLCQIANRLWIIGHTMVRQTNHPGIPYNSVFSDITVRTAYIEYFYANRVLSKNFKPFHYSFHTDEYYPLYVIDIALDTAELEWICPGNFGDREAEKERIRDWKFAQK
ncbi:YALIA101S03e05710g1_1 [Yarrowia lipolytica]|nr:Hypothetical protein YALI2_E00754g [Yarrowia lipolytica]SEI32910.1 YALIA101S03e05710g1_1 [Yarrowia lipolytica]